MRQPHGAPTCGTSVRLGRARSHAHFETVNDATGTQPVASAHQRGAALARPAAPRPARCACRSTAARAAAGGRRRRGRRARAAGPPTEIASISPARPVLVQRLAQRRPPHLRVGLARAARAGHLVGRATGRDDRRRRRVSTRTTLVAWVEESTPATSRPRVAIARSVLDTCPEGSLSLGAQHTKARDPAPIASLADGTSAVSEHTPNPEHQFVSGPWTGPLPGSCQLRRRQRPQRPPPARSSAARPNSAPA